MFSGTAYGVALNDRRQLEARADSFHQPPYGRPPEAAVLYIKPRTCVTAGGAPTPLPPELGEVEIASTLALLFGGSPGAKSPDVSAVCLALDVSEWHQDFYRPAIRQRCRDGFLPLGRWTSPQTTYGDLVTEIDGREVHRWSLDRLFRPIDALVAELHAYLDFSPGDLLLVGLPGDAPRAALGQSVVVRSEGLPSLQTTIVAEVVS
ncbi:MAG TPA: fumarylacetoacetate hydrolase family protein [Caulobacteraceae bacterium]|jgi:5-oxopent-3-ene-1,2,5-tricarboxylate decarboxylase/2-hydroxyhepta-2,4-diene-1,7-dioate isomerase|nr:fumarylacetoacetate hydrolase family protein [Caulobacteraceae bacterium]